MTDRYQNLDRKQKQIIASQYPYKPDILLFDSTLGNSFESKKFFSNRQQLMDFKEQAAQDDVALQKRRDFVVSSEGDGNSEMIAFINAALSSANEEEYRVAIEMASHEFNPVNIIKALIILQWQRVERAMDYERKADMGSSQETEATITTAMNLTKLLNDMVNGQKLDVKMEGSLSSMIMNMDLGDDLDFNDDEDIIDIRGEADDEVERV